MKIFLCVVAIGLMLTLLGYLNYSGICISEGRRLTDEERIRHALGLIIHKRKFPVETGEGYIEYYEHIPYASVEEYLKLYPGCCKVNPGEFYAFPRSSFFDRITGYNSNDVIEVKYFVHYIDENGKKQSMWKRIYGYQQNCGGNSLLKWED